MAVLSPGLVFALVVMFLLTRVHQLYFTFEHYLYVVVRACVRARRPSTLHTRHWDLTFYCFSALFSLLFTYFHSFFGLEYCLEPSPTRMTEITNAGTRDSSSSSSSTNRKRKDSTPSRLTPAIVPLVRNKVSATLFATKEEFPRHAEFDHILGMTVAYLFSFFGEEMFMCILPESNAIAGQIHWFSFLIILMAIAQLIRTARTYSSDIALLTIAIFAFTITLGLIANGDMVYFFQLQSAFIALGISLQHVFVHSASLEPAVAEIWSQQIVIAMRLLTALFVAVLVAASLVPARRFANLDFALLQRYRREEAEAADDPYTLPKPTSLLAVLVLADYVFPLVVLSVFTLPREAEYHWSRLGLLVGLVVYRFALARVRMQSHLDDGASAYYDFWRVRAAGMPVLEAAQRLRAMVVSTYYFLPTFGLLYVCLPLVLLMLAFTAKRSGAIGVGLCEWPVDNTPNEFSVFAREVPAFVAWLVLAAHTFFSWSSLVWDMLVNVGQKGDKHSTPTYGTPMNSSEKRRLRKMHGA